MLRCHPPNDASPAFGNPCVLPNHPCLFLIFEPSPPSSYSLAYGRPDPGRMTHLGGQHVALDGIAVLEKVIALKQH